MPVSSESGESRNQSDDSFYRVQKGGTVSKLIPIVFGLIVGMLIMLLIVHFFPREHEQSEVQSTQTAPADETPAGSEAIPTAPVTSDIGQANANMTRIQVSSPTASGYPVVNSGAPRAVDYFGPQDTVIQTDNRPDSIPTTDASTNPCVDPPSVKGQSYRYVEH